MVTEVKGAEHGSPTVTPSAARECMAAAVEPALLLSGSRQPCAAVYITVEGKPSSSVPLRHVQVLGIHRGHRVSVDRDHFHLQKALADRPDGGYVDSIHPL